ncbi:hypothetical protein OH492_10080 [Vibrio chagasii]|nr:hypothetical protein [Vibrio chagasii]
MNFFGKFFEKKSLKVKSRRMMGERDVAGEIARLLAVCGKTRLSSEHEWHFSVCF